MLALGVQPRNKLAIAAPYDVVDTVLAVPLEHGSRQNVIRVLVLGQRIRRLGFHLLDGCVYDTGQIRSGLSDNVAAVGCHKCRPDHRTVFVDNVRVAHDVIHPHDDVALRETRQRGSEEKKVDPSIDVKRADL